MDSRRRWGGRRCKTSISQKRSSLTFKENLSVGIYAAFFTDWKIEKLENGRFIIVICIHGSLWKKNKQKTKNKRNVDGRQKSLRYSGRLILHIGTASQSDKSCLGKTNEEIELITWHHRFEILLSKCSSESTWSVCLSVCLYRTKLCSLAGV